MFINKSAMNKMLIEKKHSIKKIYTYMNSNGLLNGQWALLNYL